uniref:adenylate cyclase n=1 Tax=Trypanosoma congolense (strain IL3000) TaxID=1068625 RepID=G0UM87_TRYCI|nr:conserved hypothetical protein [Trypanosoma congolense IL3000]
MSDETAPNVWKTPNAAAVPRPTGIVGGHSVPGTYLKTVTGVQRGEELFHRPDLERPWRSPAGQRHAMTVALKEKEIECLMRRCSDLRTQLGNERHERKFVEFSISQKASEEATELRKEIGRLEALLKEEQEKQVKLQETMEHQLRIQRLQFEKDQFQLKNECQILNERVGELTRIYQQQVTDIKGTACQELEHLESLCKTRVEELLKELEAARATNRVQEEQRAEDRVRVKNMISKVEAEYKEKFDETERRSNDMRGRLEAEIQRLSLERSDALKEVATTTERLAGSLATADDVRYRFKQWDTYILRVLDDIYTSFVNASPEKAVEPRAVDVHETTLLYAPRCIAEDPEAKVTFERIVGRLLQLKSIDFTDGNPMVTQTDANLMLERLNLKQERLSRTFMEIDGKCAEAIVTSNRVLCRLSFFCDDLESAISHSGSVPPPQRDVVFVCLRVFNGARLWADDVVLARTAVSLMNCALRPKMTQYGAYECYSDGVSMLLAFDDPVAACRFCAEAQQWLMRLPWPQSLLESGWGGEQRSECTGEVIIRGLRVSMAIHAGDTFIEPLSIPCGNSYRCHYYGRAVSQVMSMCSMAHGGQILVSQPVWDLCTSRRHELGTLVMEDIGLIPTPFFSSAEGVCENEPIHLHQIFAASLRGRNFKDVLDVISSGKMDLSALHQSVMLAELKGVEGRCSFLRDAISVADEEFKAVDSCVRALTFKAREAKSHFHLFPPAEMVTHLNNMYAVMERIAFRASDLRENLVKMDRRQDDLEAQTRDLKNQYFHATVSSNRLKETQVKVDTLESNYGEQIRGMRSKYEEMVGHLHREIQDRDRTIEKMCKSTQ